MDGAYEESISDFVPLIKEELNVKNVIFENELDKYMNFSVKPNFRNAGPALGKEVGALGKALAGADAKDVIEYAKKGNLKFKIGGKMIDIPEDFIDVRISAKKGFVVGMENNVFTILDTTLTPDLIEEGLMREVISKVQQLRKQHNFEMMDKIKIYIDADEEVSKAINDNIDFIKKETIAEDVAFDKNESLDTFDINGHKTGIEVERLK